MRKPTIALTIALVLLALTAAACNRGGGNSTPTAAFQTFYNSLKNKDVAGLKLVLKKKTLEEIEKDAKAKNKPLDDFLKEEFIEQVSKKMPATMPETRDEKIDGDTATLEMKEDDKWKPIKFVKESDGWKVGM